MLTASSTAAAPRRSCGSRRRIWIFAYMINNYLDNLMSSKCVWTHGGLEFRLTRKDSGKPFHRADEIEMSSRECPVAYTVPNAYLGNEFGFLQINEFMGPTSTTNITSLQSLSPPPYISSKPMMMYWLLSGKKAIMCWKLSGLLLLPL